MNLREAFRSRLRQERQSIIFEAPNGNFIHERILPYAVSHVVLGLTPVGIRRIRREHPLAEWKIDPEVPIVIEAIG